MIRVICITVGAHGFNSQLQRNGIIPLKEFSILKGKVQKRKQLTIKKRV
jgi:hypothetical protein